MREHGKCWIYKRADLRSANDERSLTVDYSDGTEEFDCVVHHQGRYPVFEWHLPGDHVVPIGLNIPRAHNNGIVRNGLLPYGEDGDTLYWELIFGKFKSYPDYYYGKVVSWCPFLLVLGIALMYMGSTKPVQTPRRYF